MPRWHFIETSLAFVYTPARHTHTHTRFFTQTDTLAHRLTAFYLPNIYKAVGTPPASQNPACPPYKVNEFHATAAVASDYQVEGLYSPILINLNHLPEKHSQRDISAYVCQSIPIPEIHLASNAFQEYTCTHTPTDVDGDTKTNTCKHRFRTHMYTQNPLPARTNVVQK